MSVGVYVRYVRCGRSASGHHFIVYPKHRSTCRHACTHTHTHTPFTPHPPPTHLITSSTSWLHFLGMMSAAVKFVVLWIIEVDEINEQLLTLLAGKTSWVPAFVSTRTFSKHSNTADFDGHFAFFTGLRMGEREGGMVERGEVGGREGRGKERGGEGEKGKKGGEKGG